MLIRRMTENDLDAVMAIEAATFTLPWSRQSYEGELTNGYACYMVADVDGVIVAYGGIWTVFEEARMTNIAVAEAWRGQHIGEALMQALELYARRCKCTVLQLEVRKSNEIAKNLYHKLDFIPVGERKGYYEDNREDAITMTKLLVGSGKPHWLG